MVQCAGRASRCHRASKPTAGRAARDGDRGWCGQRPELRALPLRSLRFSPSNPTRPSASTPTAAMGPPSPSGCSTRPPVPTSSEPPTHQQPDPDPRWSWRNASAPSTVTSTIPPQVSGPNAVHGQTLSFTRKRPPCAAPLPARPVRKPRGQGGSSPAADRRSHDWCRPSCIPPQVYLRLRTDSSRPVTASGTPADHVYPHPY